MPARLRKTHQEDVRTKIQASQIINRLQKHIVGDIEMSASQVNAAKILLGKSLPDLSSVQLSGDTENPVAVSLIQLVPLK